MKTVLLLLLIVSSAVTVSAQKNHRDKREYQRQMAQINAEFDARARSIRKNPFMGRNQKNRKINELEMHRRVALRDCRDRFTNSRSREYVRERNHYNRR